MRQTLRCTLCLISMMCTHSPVHAQEPPAEPPRYDIADETVEGELIKPAEDAKAAAKAALASAEQASAAAARAEQAAQRAERAADAASTNPIAEAARVERKIGDVTSTFIFGSYARMRAATDLDGRTPRQVNVVGHGSRIDEANYAELEFQQRFDVAGAGSDKFYMQMVATLALVDEFFHYSGQFDQTIATRNLYGDGGWKSGALILGFWAGSRMYRGDDIYLLDFWALDNLNTLGGGAYGAWDWAGLGRTELKLHSGVSRLKNGFQYQEVDVPGLGVGADRVVFLDRQRTISTFRLQQDLWLSVREDKSPKAGAKLVLYGESHDLPAGQRREADGFGVEQLPAESGSRLGAELGIWTADGLLSGSFANLFVAHDAGLAAYGEFGVPQGVSLGKTAEGAARTTLALSGAIETPWAGALVGSYYRSFNDADRETDDYDDYWEMIFALRAHAYLTDHIHPGFEISHQVRTPQGVYAGTGEYEAPTVTKLSLIQALSLKKGMYSRPQLRFIYTYIIPNDSTRNLYRPEDYRSELTSQHYLGVMVEWWFNNASLFRP
jgi:maltoporin